MGHRRRLKSIFQTLASYKLRTVLLMAALSSGTAVLLLTFSLRAGTQKRVAGIQALFFRANEGTVLYREPEGKANAHATPYPTRLQDLRLLQSRLSREALFSGEIQKTETVAAGGRSLRPFVMAAGPSFFAIRGWKIVKGDGLDASDERTLARNCILTVDTARHLFHSEDVIGRQVLIGGTPFVIKGLRPADPLVMRLSAEAARQVMIPLATGMRRLWGMEGPYSIRFGVRRPFGVAKLEKDIKGLLRESHHIVPPRPDDFEFMDGTRLVARFRAARATLFRAGLGLSLLAFLLSAAIVAITMTASVAHRRAEIALRCALGASQRDICAETLWESLLVSAAGFVTGVGLSFAAVWLWHSFAGRMAIKRYPLAFAPAGFLWAAAAALVVGVAAGAWAARRAWSVHPGRTPRGDEDAVAGVLLCFRVGREDEDEPRPGSAVVRGCQESGRQEKEHSRASSCTGAIEQGRGAT